MLIRIVTMKFEQKHISIFETLFNERKDRIRAVKGCEYLELLQDNSDPTVFTTYSIWKDDQALNTYRKSEFFQDTWKKTKDLFQEKPIARSYHLKASLD